MHYLGNIVTETKFEESPIYNIVKDYNDIVPDIPTLIVSWKKVQELFPNVNILDWKISDNLYWCFGKRERNYRYQEDTIKFRKLVIERAKNEIEYKFFNILTEDKESKRNFTNNLKENLTSYYIKNDFVYAYVQNDKIVYGISLRDIEYSGSEKKNFLNMLGKIKNAEKITINYDEIPLDIMVEINNHTFIIPYIFTN